MTEVNRTLKITLVVFLYLVSDALFNPAHAVWINVTGRVDMVSLYTTTDTIVVRLSESGSQVAACSNTTEFAIDGAIPENRRQQLLSVLLTAKASDSEVTIAYNDTGGCVAWGADPNVYRGALRVNY